MLLPELQRFFEENMKRRNIKGEIIEDGYAPRSAVIRARITAEEMDKVTVMMENYGYKTVSSFLRDLLFKKRLETHREIVNVTDKVLRDKMNNVIFQINKIGVNYNQVVALYQQQAKMFRPDGRPYLNTPELDRRFKQLMKMTDGLRDEVAVLITLFKTYLSAGDNTEEEQPNTNTL